MLVGPEPSGNSYYKFIIETTDDKSKAVKRYYNLRSYGNKVLMETSDSINYKIYYRLPATTSDTLRIRDSLNLVFYKNTNPVRVRIEQ